MLEIGLIKIGGTTDRGMYVTAGLEDRGNKEVEYTG